MRNVMFEEHRCATKCAQLQLVIPAAAGTSAAAAALLQLHSLGCMRPELAAAA
jgi:hypothetical protein